MGNREQQLFTDEWHTRHAQIGITIGSVFTVTVMMIQALTMILFSQYRKCRLRI
jgi:hypothetical protein